MVGLMPPGLHGRTDVPVLRIMVGLMPPGLHGRTDVPVLRIMVGLMSRGCKGRTDVPGLHGRTDVPEADDSAFATSSVRKATSPSLVTPLFIPIVIYNYYMVLIAFFLSI